MRQGVLKTFDAQCRQKISINVKTVKGTSFLCPLLNNQKISQSQQGNAFSLLRPKKYDFQN